jgi:general secretion pathway protein E
MTQQQRDIVAESVSENKGLVLVAAPPGNGLTALLYGLVQEHDAFVQHIITLERPVERELEGTTQQELAVGIEPADEAKQVSWIADQMPDVFMTTGIEGRDAAREAIRLAGEERRRVYIGMRATDTADALTRWRTLVGDNKAALSRLEMIIAGRTVRKLCDACKEPYTPPEAALAKMGVPKGKVQQLFRARTEPMLDQRGNPVPCEFCNQLGYKGRLGVFEVVLIDSEARKALMQDPSPATIRNLLRAQKLPTLNEAALRSVIAGKTDLGEIQRGMGPSSTPAPSGGGGPGGAPRRAKAPPAPAA